MKALIIINQDGNSGFETIEGRVLNVGTTHVKVTIDDTYNKLRHPLDAHGEWFPLNSRRVKVSLSN